MKHVMQVRWFSKNGSSLFRYSSIAFVFVWLTFLSGLLGGFSPAPGVVQAMQLDRALNERKLKLQTIEAGNVQLAHEIERLKNHRLAQEQEIRRVLGYVGKDEMIIDFSK